MRFAKGVRALPTSVERQKRPRVRLPLWGRWSAPDRLPESQVIQTPRVRLGALRSP